MSKSGPKRDDVGPGRPPKEHQFKPGNPGGPGRPMGSVGLLQRIRRKLEQEGPSGKRRADEVAEACVQAAVDGDFKFAKEILDRFEGKIPDRMTLTVEDVAGSLERVAGAVLKAVPAEFHDAVLECFDRELGAEPGDGG